jgi:hypothetical protein
MHSHLYNAELGCTRADVTICVADFRVWIDGPAAVPNDPDLPQQWALNDVKVGTVWAANQFGHKDIKVCMVDTGSDLTHPDLQANLWINPGEASGLGANAANGYINGKDDDGNGMFLGHLAPCLGVCGHLTAEIHLGTFVMGYLALGSSKAVSLPIYGLCP